MLLSLKQLVMAILWGILFAGRVQEFLIFSLQMIAYYSIEQLLWSVHIFSVFWQQANSNKTMAFFSRNTSKEIQEELKVMLGVPIIKKL